MKTEKITRRNFLKSTLGVVASMSVVGILPKKSSAEECELTPQQPEGPFYPIQDQLDKDNDLTHIKDRFIKAK